MTRAAPGKGTRFPEEIALRIPRPPAHNNSTGVFKMQNQTNKESQNRHGQPSAHGKQHKAHGHVEQARRDGQTATSEKNVYENLAENAWFPALYADEVLMDESRPGFSGSVTCTKSLSGTDRTQPGKRRSTRRLPGLLSYCLMYFCIATHSYLPIHN